MRTRCAGGMVATTCLRTQRVCVKVPPTSSASGGACTSSRGQADGPQDGVPHTEGCEMIQDRKELIFFIAIGGLVVATLVVVVSRFV